MLIIGGVQFSATDALNKHHKGWPVFQDSIDTVS